MSEAETAPAAPAAPSTYRRPLPAGWWYSRPSYLLYVVRELTVVFMVAWLVWFLYEVALLKQNAFSALSGNYAVLAFSLVCLFFTLWHALTFLNLSGLILRLPIGEGHAPAVAIRALAFGGLVVATVAGGAVMIYLGYQAL